MTLAGQLSHFFDPGFLAMAFGYVVVCASYLAYFLRT